jgi:hypothetical protein
MGMTQHDEEARSVIELLRLSGVTVLVGQREHNAAFLQSALLPQLTEQAKRDATTCVFFDAWNDSPLPDLGTDALRARQQGPNQGLILVFGRFEDFLRRTNEGRALEFYEQLIQALKTASLPLNVLISIDEAAEPLLAPLRERLRGIGDATLRLKPRHRPVSTKDQTGRVAGEVPAAPPEAPVIEPRPPVVQPEPPVVQPGPAVVRPEAPVVQPKARVPTVAVASAEPVGVERASRRPRVAWLAFGAIAAAAFIAVSVIKWEQGAALIRAVLHTDSPAPASASTDSQPAPAAEAVPPAPERAPPAAPTAPRAAQAVPPAAQTEPRAAQAAPPAAQTARPAAAAPTPPAEVIAPVAKAPAVHPQQQQAAVSAPAANVVKAATADEPVIHIHVRDEEQRARATRFAPVLRKHGIRVSRINVVETGPEETDMRYFRNDEAQEAARVAQTLRKIGLVSPQVKRISGYENTAPRRQYELWLGPDDGEEGRREQR